MSEIKIDLFSPQRQTWKPSLKNMSVNDCVCCRPKSHVLCKNCGWLTRGRIRFPCPKHPNVIFINDYGKCPICGLSDNILAEC